MTDDTGPEVRVRFAPSPSGDLHVGNIRTALYNWAYARHTGGTFILRVEDTDRARVTDEYYHAALDTLRWLGLTWDEGPDVGGPHGPYRQSERMEIYRTTVERFLDEGHAYHCYCTPEELKVRRQAARGGGGGPTGYDGHCRALTSEQVSAYRAEGRRPAVRFRMPAGSTTFTDTLRGMVSFDHAHVPDFVLVRGDGHPLYTLCVAVDDVLMRVSHVVRGDDLLSSTPRQLAVYRAMGVPDRDFPTFCHLPYVLGQDGQALSKRNGVVSISWYRDEGFLPEAMDNYLALLGWSPGDNRELFSLEEMARDFTLDRVGRAAARFDMKKLEAINGDRIRALPSADFVGRVTPFLRRAGLTSDPPDEEDLHLIEEVAPLVQSRVSKLADVAGMVGFLFVDERDFAVEPDARRSLTVESRPVLEETVKTLDALPEWEPAVIERALRGALVDTLGLKPRNAFAPVRAAVTGRRVSPPLFESIWLLGRERTIGRLRSAVESIE